MRPIRPCAIAAVALSLIAAHALPAQAACKRFGFLVAFDRLRVFASVVVDDPARVEVGPKSPISRIRFDCDALS